MKIIVIASPRTASTWFCKKLANDHNIKNFNELLTDQLQTSNLSVHLVSKLTNELIKKDSGVFKVILSFYNGQKITLQKISNYYSYVPLQIRYITCIDAIIELNLEVQL
mgnify:CR=1 FL=1